MRLKYKSVLAICVILITIQSAPIASSVDPVESCKFPAPTWQTVSLGFPVREERLVHLGRPQILVIPIRLADTANFQFTEEMKNEYLQAGKFISNFSKGKSNIDFKFNKTIDTSFTTKDMVELQRTQKQSYDSIGGPSTWNYVAKVLAENDSTIDFSGIDAVVMHASSADPVSEIAEAMMYYRSAEKPFMRPNKTAEGEILNIVLLDKRKGVNTITHEIMHLYGLTDLYGTSTGPGRLSLMASNEMTLLTYEKWILGWHPDAKVQCLNKVSNNFVGSVNFDYSTPDNLLLLKTSGGATYVAETQRDEYDRRFISFYSLNQEARPPITLYQKPENRRFDGINIASKSVVGAVFEGPDLSMAITQMSDSTLTLLVYATEVSNSQEVTEAISKALGSKTEIKPGIDTPVKIVESPKPIPSTATKRTTITCVKGKLVKKVSAFSPKCPSGYKKK